MKITIRIQTDCYNKSVVITDDDIKVYNNLYEVDKNEKANRED